MHGEDYSGVDAEVARKAAEEANKRLDDLQAGRIVTVTEHEKLRRELDESNRIRSSLAKKIVEKDKEHERAIGKLNAEISALKKERSVLTYAVERAGKEGKDILDSLREVVMALRIANDLRH